MDIEATVRQLAVIVERLAAEIVYKTGSVGAQQVQAHVRQLIETFPREVNPYDERSRN
jgi:hypothetical protein